MRHLFFDIGAGAPAVGGGGKVKAKAVAALKPEGS
jgi:hypothetical protein